MCKASNSAENSLKAGEYNSKPKIALTGAGIYSVKDAIPAVVDFTYNNPELQKKYGRRQVKGWVIPPDSEIRYFFEERIETESTIYFRYPHPIVENDWVGDGVVIIEEGIQEFKGIGE